MPRHPRPPQPPEGQLPLGLTYETTSDATSRKPQHTGEATGVEDSDASSSMPLSSPPFLLACTHVTLAEAARVTGIPREAFRLWVEGDVLDAVEVEAGARGDSVELHVAVIDVLRLLMSKRAGVYALQPVLVPIDSLVRDPKFQVRVGTRATIVKRYSVHYDPRKKCQMPPLATFRLEGQNMVVDGFHRAPAAKMAGRECIEVFFLPGDLRWARIAARHLNDRNSLKISDQDRRRQLLFFLEDNPQVLERLKSGELTYRAFESETGFTKTQIGNVLKLLRKEQTTATATAAESTCVLEAMRRDIATLKAEPATREGWIKAMTRIGEELVDANMGEERLPPDSVGVGLRDGDVPFLGGLEFFQGILERHLARGGLLGGRFSPQRVPHAVEKGEPGAFEDLHRGFGLTQLGDGQGGDLRPRRRRAVDALHLPHLLLGLGVFQREKMLLPLLAANADQNAVAHRSGFIPDGGEGGGLGPERHLQGLVSPVGRSSASVKKVARGPDFLGFSLALCFGGYGPWGRGLPFGSRCWQ